MKIKTGGQTFAAILENNETAKAFAALLPMELSMTELNGTEKYHYLMSGLPCATEPIRHISAGDIMLFGDNCVVLFYRSFDTPYTYTRIGRIIDTEWLAAKLGSGEASVRFEKD